MSVAPTYHRAERDGITSALLLGRTLGQAHPHLTIDFASIVEGANIPLNQHRALQPACLLSYSGVCSPPLSCIVILTLIFGFQPLKDLKSLKGLIAFAYSRQINSPDDLICRLAFTQIGADTPVYDLTGDGEMPTVNHPVFQDRFETWLREFLRQPGYTQKIIDLFPNLPELDAQDQSCLRARLLLRAASGSEFLPIEDDEKAINVSYRLVSLCYKFSSDTLVLVPTSPLSCRSKRS